LPRVTSVLKRNPRCSGEQRGRVGVLGNFYRKAIASRGEGGKANEYRKRWEGLRLENFNIERFKYGHCKIRERRGGVARGCKKGV